jgi:hypothetical protein
MYVFKSPDLPWNSTNVTVLPTLEKAKLENVRCFIIFDYPEFMGAVMEAAYSLVLTLSYHYSISFVSIFIDVCMYV